LTATPLMLCPKGRDRKAENRQPDFARAGSPKTAPEKKPRRGLASAAMLLDPNRTLRSTNTLHPLPIARSRSPQPAAPLPTSATRKTEKFSPLPLRPQGRAGSPLQRQKPQKQDRRARTSGSLGNSSS